MNLTSIAVIMAPNLFLSSSSTKKVNKFKKKTYFKNKFYKCFKLDTSIQF